MCGINGFTTRGRTAGTPDLEVLEQMNAALVHRGPDEGGTTAHGRSALGIRRLSIIDVAHGQQPMCTRDGALAVVFNGELYDYTRRRQDLLARGADFDTHCDTEVILQSWAHDGPACLDDFNGMFGFAVSNARDGSLTLVRDQIGIKPLYYYHAPAGDLYFSSELGSLVAHPAVPRQLDHDSLAMLLVDRYVADPYTMYRGVRQLPPGHLLHWRDGNVDVRSYYQFRPEAQNLSEGEALEEMRRRLEESVRSQLVADVPVAAFLSGGIDSSAVVAHAAGCLEDRKLHTFTVGFEHSAYDESRLAALVARHCGTEHHELRVENSSFDPLLLQRVVRHVGQPLGDTSCIPTYIVSEFASRHVKVVVSGDGGDEFFAGYRHMLWAGDIARAKKRYPVAMRRAAAHALRVTVPVTPSALGPAMRRVRRGLDATFPDPPEMMRRLLALWQPEEVADLLDTPMPSLRPASCRPIVDPARVEPETYAGDYLSKTLMVGGILRKVDRMSMAASLEVRVPLLDRRVFEFALTLPLELKLRDRTGKYLLREAVRPLLPAEVFSHPKQGFSIPLRDWFNDAFWEMTRELTGPGTEVARLFKPGAIEGVLSGGLDALALQHRTSLDAAAARAWLLAQLGQWMQTFRVLL